MTDHLMCGLCEGVANDHAEHNLGCDCLDGSAECCVPTCLCHEPCPNDAWVHRA